ncbi:hypothetical protein PTKIN_Ptkin09bG0209700 [Pterospermum kingtungense]
MFWHQREQLELGLLLCWFQWSNRNICFHDNICKLPNSVFDAASILNDEFITANQPQPVAPNASSFWQPPEGGVIKINVDASHCQTTKAAVIGIVAPDHYDCIFLAELKAIQEGLLCARQDQFSRIIIESDCLLAVNEVRKGLNSLSEWCGVIKDIVHMRESFQSCLILHVSRECNHPADAIAKYASNVNEYTDWRDSLPPDVYNTDTLALVEDIVVEYITDLVPKCGRLRFDLLLLVQTGVCNWKGKMDGRAKRLNQEHLSCFRIPLLLWIDLPARMGSDLPARMNG